MDVSIPPDAVAMRNSCVPKSIVVLPLIVFDEFTSSPSNVLKITWELSIYPSMTETTCGILSTFTTIFVPSSKISSSPTANIDGMFGVTSSR